ncbi:FecR family protein [Aureispira anguillae]|uniref:FecR domain-containing protein n=1 Tax=Aureispira anguillae TaxID=2864201 RepID=A0A916DNG2_9BACT|nr:FecR domain-containing protein [Aureispira anguillae]BDS09864.1 FecR domain-containing protein [Aureispira anguillae]
MSNDKYFNLLSKVLLGNASSEEEKVLEQWTKEDHENQAFVEETTKVWNLSENYAENLPVDTDLAWSKFETKFNQKYPEQKTVIRSLLTWKVAAAVIGLIALSFWWIYQKDSMVLAPMAQIETGKKEQKEITLPDGSVVMLNEGSSLSYKKSFTTRSVHLKGEAFFEVTKQAGEPFEIITTTTKTTVLGTSFNVRAYENKDVEVAVLTGKVAVEGRKGRKEKVLLLPNEAAVYKIEENTIEKETQVGVNSIAWKTQELVFKNTELSEVIKTLEQYFEVEITGDRKILNCHYTGTFRNSNLDEIFNTIAFTFPTDLKIKKVNKKYILIGQGCE